MEWGRKFDFLSLIFGLNTRVLSYSDVTINGTEMSPAIKHAGWGTKGESLLAVFRMLFLEEGCLQPELSSTKCPRWKMIYETWSANSLITQKKTQNLKIMMFSMSKNTNHLPALINPMESQSRWSLGKCLGDAFWVGVPGGKWMINVVHSSPKAWG